MSAESRASISRRSGEAIAVVGYGNQGRAQALNLRDSGASVHVGQRAGSPRHQQALDDGFQPEPIPEAVDRTALIILALPDEVAGDVFEQQIAPALRHGQCLGLLHGFAVVYEFIRPPEDIDVVLLSPKGPGTLVRDAFQQGSGVPAFWAVHQDATGKARTRVMHWADLVGASRAGLFETTLREETEADLFGEQAVLCGGLSALLQAGFDTLVEAGFSPELAYFECVHEFKQIADLVYRHGIAGMRERISRTAGYGDVTRGPRVIDDHVRQRMREVLAEVRTGEFARQWHEEHRQGRPTLTRTVEAARQSLLERVGAEIRQRLELSGVDEAGSDSRR